MKSGFLEFNNPDYKGLETNKLKLGNSFQQSDIVGFIFSASMLRKFFMCFLGHIFLLSTYTYFCIYHVFIS